MTDPAGDLATVASLRPAAAVAIPAVGAVLVAASRSRPRLRDALALAAALATAAVVASMIPDLLAGRVHVTHAGELVPGVPFSLRADPVGLPFALAIAGLSVLAVPVATWYRRHHELGAETRYMAALTAALAAAIGVALAGNLLVLFGFAEVLTLATYPLVVHAETRTARRASYAYLAYAFAGGLAVLGGLRVVLWLSGSVAFAPGGIPGIATEAAAEPWIARLGFGLLLVGFGVKAALVPLYGWLVAARVAPPPAFGLVFATVVLKTGAFGIVRTVLDVFGPATTAALGVADATVALAAATVLVAGLAGLGESDLRRRLTYATIVGGAAAVGGVGTLAPAAIVGAVVHLVTHAVATVAVFLAVAVLGAAADVASVRDLADSAGRLPVARAALAVGIASLVGLPLSAGFVGSWHLLLGAVETGHWLAVGAVLGAVVLHVAILWPVLAAALFGRADGVAAATAPARSPDPSRDDGASVPAGGDDSADADARSGLTPPVTVALLVATAALVALGTIPGRLVVLEAARLAVEAATGVTVP